MGGDTTSSVDVPLQIGGTPRESRSVRAISFEELTQDEPILVLTTSLHDACAGAGGLLAACHENYGAHVVHAFRPTVGASPGGDAQCVASNTADRNPVQTIHHVAVMSALGSNDPESAISTLSSVIDASGTIDRQAVAQQLARMLRACGARSIFIPNRAVAQSLEPALSGAARLLCSDNRRLRLWHFSVPDCPAPGLAPIDMRLFDIHGWSERKRAALRVCADEPHTTMRGNADFPAERFWQTSRRRPRRP